jgi:hypothetical protein
MTVSDMIFPERGCIEKAAEGQYEWKLTSKRI